MQLTDDSKILGRLGAGPFENFLGMHGEKYIDVIHILALEEKRLREVLDDVWPGSMPKSVWHLIETLKQKSFSKTLKHLNDGTWTLRITFQKEGVWRTLIPRPFKT